MHPNAPQARAAGLRPGHQKNKLLRWASNFAGHLVAPEGGTLRWLDEFAGHISFEPLRWTQIMPGYLRWTLKMPGNLGPAVRASRASLV